MGTFVVREMTDCRLSSTSETLMTTSPGGGGDGGGKTAGGDGKIREQVGD